MPRSRRSWILSIVTSANSSQRTRLKGIAAAPGQAFAPAWRWTEPSLESARPAAAGQLGADELERAVEQVKARLAVTTARLHAGGASAEAGILEAQALMLEDPALLEGARELVLNGTPADVAVADTMALGYAYRANALDHRQLYQVMFGSAALGGFAITDGDRQHGRYTLQPLVEAVARAIEQGGFRPDDPLLVAQTMWIALHGLVSLELGGYLTDPYDADVCFEAQLCSLMVGAGDDHEAACLSSRRARRRRSAHA